MNQAYHIFHHISSDFTAMSLRFPASSSSSSALRGPANTEAMAPAPRGRFGGPRNWSMKRRPTRSCSPWHFASCTWLHFSQHKRTQTYTNVHKRTQTSYHNITHAHSQSKVSFISVMFSCSLSKSFSLSCTNFHEFLLRLFLGSSHGTSWHTVFPFECLWIRFKMFRHVWSKWMHV